MPAKQKKETPNAGSGSANTGSPRSSDFAKRRISQILENERAVRERCQNDERVIHRIATRCGSPSFIWIQGIFFGIWILANTLLPATLRWDPFPFTFLTLVVSLEAIFLSAFVLVTANREATITERRLHLDLQINLMTEAENTQMLTLLNRISDRLGIKHSDDPESQALADPTDPTQILEEIDRELGKNADPRQASLS